MGGLSAAIRLAQRGYEVSVFEARSSGGGLASSVRVGGLRFDAGPYVLLDRPGLEWVFHKLGIAFDEDRRLCRLDPVYEVQSADFAPMVFYADREQTASGLDQQWPGTAKKYLRFVRKAEDIYRRLQPMQRVARPGVRDLLRTGAWRDARFLSRGLMDILSAAELPPPVANAVGIWTHIAGQRLSQAPSPLGLVPALIHSMGAYYPRGGIGTLAESLYRRAESEGVRFHFDTKVCKVRFDATSKSYPSVDVALDRATHRFDALVSNYSGIGTYLDLVDGLASKHRRRLEAIPLQSPGVCAYLKVRGDKPSKYLSFRLDEARCRLMIQPRAIDPALESGDWFPARLVAPYLGEQPERYLDELIEETWFRDGWVDYEVVDTRTPPIWGRDFHLYRDSMNPVMTARLMRRGRLAHRSPTHKGLYLTGSSTHPGQWVSFCAISGILAADSLHEDFS